MMIQPCRHAVATVSLFTLSFGVCSPPGRADLPSPFPRPAIKALVAVKDLKEGQVIKTSDVALQSRELSPNSARFIILQTGVAEGWVVRRSVPAGDCIRKEDVIWASILRLGKDVKQRDLIKWEDLKPESNVRLKEYPGKIVDSSTFLQSGMCAKKNMKAGHLLTAADVYAPVICSVTTPAQQAAKANELANSLEYQKKWAEAIKAYTEAIDLTKGKQPSALYSRGKCYEQLGQLELALKDATRAIELEPNYWGAYDTRAKLLLKMKRYKEAHKDATTSLVLAKKISVTPDNLVSPLVRRAQASLNMQLHDNALADLNEAIKLSPTGSGEALYVRSLLNSKRGKTADAAADLAKAKKLGYAGEGR